ncbi:MAG: hypothetical protein RhofKO_04890 [Rhodothermales bacterium]
MWAAGKRPREGMLAPSAADNKDAHEGVVAVKIGRARFRRAYIWSYTHTLGQKCLPCPWGSFTRSVVPRQD